MHNDLSLHDILNRSLPPTPWAEGDNIPWDEPEFSARMLKEHLSQEHGMASRRLTDVADHVAWLFESVLGGQPGQVLDLACGPGLYLNELCRRGCTGVGIDFSPASIEYARGVTASEGLDCRFEQADLRTASFGSGYRLAFLVFGQINGFRREHARQILERTSAALEPGGLLVVEPQNTASMRGSGLPTATWSTFDAGLFSSRPHLQLHEVFWDEPTRTRTERWHIVDCEDGSVARHALSCSAWDPDELETTLRSIGFDSVEIVPSLKGTTGPEDEWLYVLKARRA